MKQHVRFCTARDGVRLAYAVHGSGPPLVRVATWLSHLELDWESRVWRHWLKQLGDRHTVVRYDERGCGLSDTNIGEPSVDVWVSDLETVVDTAGLERFALLGVSQAAAIAVAYAARHPDRVSDLVLYGGYARGRRFRGEDTEEEAIVAAIHAGWTAPNPAFRRMFSMLFLPNGTPEQMAWYEELLWRSTTAGAAAALYRARGGLNVCDLAPQVRARTLVMHARDDRVVPVQEGRLLAALIPDAHLVLLDSANHILLEQEPAWDVFLSEIEAFLGTDTKPSPPMAVAGLSAREVEVLRLVSEGLTNQSIAARLCLSVRTVYVVADYRRAYGDAHIGGINLAGAAVILKPPAFDHIGPGLLENAQDMCVPDLFANIAATRRFLSACTSRSLGDDELAAALAWNMVVPPAVRGALLSRELDGSDVLARVSVPVLVTHGRDDMIVLPSMAEHTLAACPTATVSWYDGVGHMPFLEASDRFDRELADLAHAARSPLAVRPGPL